MPATSAFAAQISLLATRGGTEVIPICTLRMLDSRNRHDSAHFIVLPLMRDSYNARLSLVWTPRTLPLETRNSTGRSAASHASGGAISGSRISGGNLKNNVAPSPCNAGRRRVSPLCAVINFRQFPWSFSKKQPGIYHEAGLRPLNHIRNQRSRKITRKPIYRRGTFIQKRG